MRERTVLLWIVALAVGLRLFRLGFLSLSGDEETTALAALALLEGWPPTLPGGIVYLRGLPFTALEAGVISALGLGEWSLRLLPALFAGPRVALTWWLARPLVGSRLALASAALLGVAPLDVEISRTARMYSLFALVDVAFLAAVIHASRGAGRWALGAVSGLLGVVTHAITLTHAPVPWFAAIAPRLPAKRRAGLFGLGLMVVTGFALNRPLVVAGYSGMGLPVEGAREPSSPVELHIASLRQALEDPVAAGGAVLGLVFALWLGARGVAARADLLGRLLAGAAAAAFLVASPVFGATALLVLSVWERAPLAQAARYASGPLGCGIAATLGWGTAAMLGERALVPGFEAALRLLLGFPAPNWVDLALAAPGLCGLAGIGILVATDRAARADHPAPWLALLGAAISPTLVGGLVLRAEGMRFHIHELVPLIVLALVAADAGARRLVRREPVALVLAVGLAALAVRPDLALQVPLRRHGPVASPFVSLSVAPDHRGAAAFVREHAAPDDWIVAEDALQQQLYLGRVDFWLRRTSDAAAFLRLSSEGGVSLDAYTGARHVPDLRALREFLTSSGNQTTWIVTSGECEAKPVYYRTDETRRAFTEWRPLAWYTGADGMTRVYRLDKGRPVALPAAPE